VPIWVTVKVPKDAKPGAYTGELKITAGGGAPPVVPVKVEVAGWTVPDPADHATWLELMQSPDTLAIEYGVQPWSEKHFELIGRSLKLLGEAGAGVLYIPLDDRDAWQLQLARELQNAGLPIDPGKLI
jgi:hypothetical protein